MGKVKTKVEAASEMARGVTGTQDAQGVTDSDANELMELWHHEIIALQEREFATVDEAVEALIQGVLNRIGGGAEGDEKLRSMMKMMFDTDPGLLDEIRGIFKLG